MKVSYNWLKTYLKLDASVEQINHAITFLGFEVEQVICTGIKNVENVFVGQVLTRDKHPNADKLSVCTVDIGLTHGVKTIVCGAQNYKVGDRVPVALAGAVLPGDFKIKQSKIRGQLSDGMMCSARELGGTEDNGGLLILDGQPALGRPINDVVPAGDTIFDIEVTPNRPDCQCHLGIARELAAWFKLDLAYPEIKFAGVPMGSTERRDLLEKVSVGSGEDCPLYTAHVITNVKIGPSPAWLQDRLKAVGLRPINNVVDVGNFVMLETGQPVHAFDAKKIAGRQIIVRRAHDNEKLVTLDGKERQLNSRMLVIADAEKPLVIAGIMGGANAEVDDTTTDIILEVAYFKPQGIRWTSRKLGLSTDSSYRYERGIDPHALVDNAHRTIDLILETAGGHVVGPWFRCGEDRIWESEIVLNPAFVRERIGFDIPDLAMRTALELLELNIVRDEIEDDGSVKWTVSIPSWRGDLDRPIDLVEEILRLYGTDKIPQSVVSAPGLLAEDAPIVGLNRAFCDYLVGQHFSECLNYTLRPKAEVAQWAPAMVDDLSLANPLVEDQSHLRPSLLGGLLEAIKLNQSRGTNGTRFFEAGRVFITNDGQVYECAAVGFAEVYSKDADRNWLKRESADFYTAKNHVQILAKIAGINFDGIAINAADATAAGWQAGHAASVGQLGANGFVASFGLMNLAMVKSLGIEGQVRGGFLAILPEKVGKKTAARYTPVSHFQSASRDLALVVDAGTPAEELRAKLETVTKTAAAGKFGVEKVAVFDVYQGKGLPEGAKSLAFSLVFRATDRTLTDDEVNAVFQQIQKDIIADGKTTIRG